MSARLVLSAACSLILASTATWAADLPVDADILLRGGTIYNGTDARPLAGDVAIRGDRVVGVGTFPVGTVGMEIDCRGLDVAPGFIDLHTHSDASIVDPNTRANVNYILQGCTTIVTGNCGYGPIDVAEYYAKIDQAGAGTNVAHLIPQGNLRRIVMGTANRPPTVVELAEMKKLTVQAMRDGAWGLSTGLIYVPSSYADRDEIVELAKIVSAYHGFYVSHIRDEGPALLEAVHEALEIGRRAELPVHISHFKSSGADAWGLVRRAADMIEMAQRSGRRVTADQYPYIASSTSLEATVIPTWARAGGHAEMMARLDDPNQSPRIKSAIADNLRKRGNGSAIRIADYTPRQDWIGQSVRDIAEAEKADPLDVVVQITRSGGASIVNFSMSEDDVRFVMQLPWVATASDGRAYLPSSDKPHPRNYGTFPRKIGYYAIREHVLSPEQAIRSATGLPADILGMNNRGYLKSDYFADIVVFDPKNLIDVATYDKPHQYSQGVRFLFVNGEPAVFNGQATGALAGRALKHSIGSNQ